MPAACIDIMAGNMAGLCYRYLFIIGIFLNKMLKAQLNNKETINVTKNFKNAGMLKGRRKNCVQVMKM
jgi:hypothetical protein